MARMSTSRMQANVKPSVKEVFDELLAYFGQQNWWPVTHHGQLQYTGGPKTPGEQWEVVAGAILTQNTAWKNVEKALAELKKQKLWNIPEIANASLLRLQNAVRSAGYYRQKALYLKGVAKYIQQNYDGDLTEMFSQPLGALRYELLSLKGIGPETADSIILYAVGKPRFVVDAYTQRIGYRLGWPVGGLYAKTQLFFENNLPKSVSLFQEYHALLVALGKTTCKRQPLCARCPVQKQCIKRGVKTQPVKREPKSMR